MPALLNAMSRRPNPPLAAAAPRRHVSELESCHRDAALCQQLADEREEGALHTGAGSVPEDQRRRRVIGTGAQKLCHGRHSDPKSASRMTFLPLDHNSGDQFAGASLTHVVHGVKIAASAMFG
jgi:hypothetical protein